MQDYEFRILCSGRGHTIVAVMHLNDSTAIRAAEVLAAGRPFEVWRDLECIYGAPRAAKSMARFTGASTH
jgi:hypothetical protein